MQIENLSYAFRSFVYVFDKHPFSPKYLLLKNSFQVSDLSKSVHLKVLQEQFGHFLKQSVSSRVGS